MYVGSHVSLALSVWLKTVQVCG